MSENDLEGEQILNSISKADRFNHWMYSKIEPWSYGKSIEIGSGIGNISKFFIKNNKEIVLSDLRRQYTDKLKVKFPETNVIELDLVNPDFDTAYSKLIGQFDLVFALNVIEHIKDDRTAVKNLCKLLKEGGYSFILVPAYQSLFNSFDVTLEHYRRYNKKNLERIIPNGMKKISTYNFNFAGIPGWFFVGKILNKKIIPESNMKLFNKLVPLFKLIDRITLNKIGLSVINISRKSSP